MKKEIIYEKEIYSFVKGASKAYKKFVILKNKNYQNIKEIQIEPINEEYMNKHIFIKKPIFSENSTKDNNKNYDKNAGAYFISIDEDIKEKDNHQKNKNLHIYIVTSNVNNYNLDLSEKNDELIKELLFPKNMKKYFAANGYPEFYCIGLQEIVELNTSNIVLFSGQNSANSWEIKISQILQTNYNYTLQYKENLVGILFLLFIKTTEAKNLNSSKKSIKKTGFLNYFGNKGSLFYEFTYKNKNFSFCTGHLSAGNSTKKYNERMNQLIDILNHQNDKNSIKFYENNYYFLFGDFNFRVKTDKKIFFNKIDEISNNLFNDKKKLDDFAFYSQVKEQVEKYEEERAKSSIIKNDYFLNYSDEDNDSDDDNKEIDKFRKSFKTNIKNRKINEQNFHLNFFSEFLKYDELNNLKSSLDQYGIKENEITFLPTYKYYKGTNYYNVTNRLPAWTDRILYNSNEDINCLFYDKIELKYSDHKPVYALFQVNVNNNNK